MRKIYIFTVVLVLMNIKSMGQCISSFPDTMGFESADSLEYLQSWYFDQDNTDTNIIWWNWKYGQIAWGNYAPYRGDRYLFYSELNEDWLISKCYNLDVDNYYELSFQVKAALPGLNYNLLLKRGKDMVDDTSSLSDTVAIFKKIASKTNDYGYFKLSTVFKLSEGGDYSFGWFFYGDTFDNSYFSQFGLYLDEIVMREYTCNSLEFDIGKDKTICFGDTVTFKVNSGYSKYYWNGVLTTDTFYHALTDGVVILTVEDQYGCTGTDTAIATVISIPDDTLILSGNTTFCKGGSVTAEIQLENANCSDYDIVWEPGQQTDSIVILDYENDYVYIITDSSGLCSFVSDTIQVEVLYPYDEQEICLLTVEDGKSKIIWEKEDSTNIDYFKIYRERPYIGSFIAIDSILFDSMSTYVDENSDPFTRPYTYAISIVDTCGNESGMSLEHQTIHLTISQGVNGEINLNWTEYEGFEYYTYRIYRDTISSVSTLFDSVSASVHSYTDNDPPTGNVYYQIEVVKETSCSPSRSLTSTFSNKADKYSSGIEESGNHTLNVYPNPANNKIIVENNADFAELSIYNSIGQLVHSDKIHKGINEINVSSLQSGIHFIKVITEKETFTFTQMIQR